MVFAKCLRVIKPCIISIITYYYDMLSRLVIVEFIVESSRESTTVVTDALAYSQLTFCINGRTGVFYILVLGDYEGEVRPPSCLGHRSIFHNGFSGSSMHHSVRPSRPIPVTDILNR